MACLVHPSNHDGSNVEVLMMKQHGVEKSWTVMFIISHMLFRHSNTVVSLGYTKDGEALIEIGSDEVGQHMSNGLHILEYSPVDCSHRRIMIPNVLFKFNTFMHVESLVNPS